MSDTSIEHPQPPSTGGAMPEPPRMSPLSRFLNVIFSPGAVFEDIRRNPGGWWVPIAIGAIVTGVFASLYVTRYDMALVMREQLKDHWSMKLVAGTQGPEARDKALDMTVKQVASTPVWQMQVGQVAQSFVGWALVVWFFTFLYALIALMMGWLIDVRASKIFINLAIVIGVCVAGLVIGGVLQFTQYSAGRSGGAPADAAPVTPPGWIAIAGACLTVITGLLILWAASRLARVTSLARLLGAVAYGMAPGALAALVGAIIVLVRTPDATSFEDLVPANLTLLLNLKEMNPALASLGNSLGLFSLWSLALTVIGVAKTLGRTTGEAAGIVLVPWIVWVLLKVAFAALIG